MSYRDALASVARRATLPFGFSVAVFSSGQLLMRHHGPPDLGELLLYALGTVAGYGGVRAAAHDVEDPPAQGTPRGFALGALHVVTISASIVIAALASRTPGAAAWLLGGLAMTLVYLAGSALEAVVEARWKTHADANSREDRRR